MKKPLKLIAETAEDLTIMSGLCQDATVKIGDMAYEPKRHLFALVANRYRHEDRGWFRRPKGSRVRTGLHFTNVLKAQLLGIDLKDKDQVLALLAIRTEALEDGTHALTLDFGGGPAVRLIVETIDAVLSDLGEDWDALTRPNHK